MWTNPELLASFFLTGLLGGAGHCTAMCGPIAAVVGLRGEKKGALARSLLYSAGRVTTYAFLGGVMGASGNLALLSSKAVWFQKGVMVGTGVLMCLLALLQSGLFPGNPGLFSSTPGGGVIEKAAGKLFSSGEAGVFFPAGLVLGFLPCGLLYTALVGAARAGAATPSWGAGLLTGGALLLVFGTGTALPLTLISLSAGHLPLRGKKVFQVLASLLFFAVGVSFIVKGVKF
ncbi:MAG: sulfite exporter TauE/SafE family protein [Deltaproteobacteria bacterium]|nr:MAG: sulfite exporter TauE/SafE family protein [Deltaproteobacteria bacterium]